MIETTAQTNMIEYASQSEGAGLEHYIGSDLVPVAALPKIKTIEPHFDADWLMQTLGTGGYRAEKNRVSKGRVDEIRPPQVTTWDDIPTDLPRLGAEAYTIIPDEFEDIVRMGNAFGAYKERLSRREVLALAVGTMGTDATLSPIGGHGVEQARRVFDLMTDQQQLHQDVFQAIHSRFGNTQATINAYTNFTKQVRNFDAWNVWTGVLCGALHDYGEVALGQDVPYEDKIDPNYPILESEAAVDLAQFLHYPDDNPTLKRQVDQRAMMGRAGMAYGIEQRADIGQYLHPDEIRRAIWGMERMDNPRKRHHLGDTFGPSTERREYVLSGWRAAEAIVHNYNGVANDYTMRAHLGRLYVSTQFNSLQRLTSRAKHYMNIYGFLQRNRKVIDHYFAAVGEDMQRPGAEGTFGIDPFIDYPEHEPRAGHMDREEARQAYVGAATYWNQWDARRRNSFMGKLWDTFRGTTDGPYRDVPFSEYTAQHVDPAESGKGKVRVLKPITINGQNPIHPQLTEAA